MKRETINNTILKYFKHISNSDWIIEEAYKFEFANYLQSSVDFNSQSDAEILKILLRSQTIKYDANSRGVQFIQKSGRKALKTFLQEDDVNLFRQYKNSRLESVDWRKRTMSFTALSAWLSSLFPNRLFPIPAIDLDKTINFLFETDLSQFPRTGIRYILSCQDFMKETQGELKKYPFEEIHLKVWNKFFENNPNLGIKPKRDFEQIDWNWLTQDFHLFILRKVMNLYRRTNILYSDANLLEGFEPNGIEGQSQLAIHMRYERDSILIKTIKQAAIKANPMLNCEVCGFSFYEKYGELGNGFIEAHHINPLSVTKSTITTKKDIALVCSNCHRMLHKRMALKEEDSIMTVRELKKLLKD